MRVHSGTPSLSAGDLSNHLGCRHLTTLDLAAALGQLTPPHHHDADLQVLQQRGLEHESAYLEHLQALGLTVVHPAASDTASDTATHATVAAMRTGADVISQATLAQTTHHPRWLGRADVLLRVPVPSDLGPFSYEVVDTKLARETRAGTILQLCLYSDLVAEIQGRMPERMHVVSPGTAFERETFRVADHLAYYRFVKARLGGAVTDPSAILAATYPEPVPQCDVCRWWPHCDRRRRDDDHLSLVAGISRLQRRELATLGVATLADLATRPIPISPRPRRGTEDGYVRVREQARVQLEGRLSGRPIHELLPREPERGLARLPRPSAGDVFFDIEGDPFVDPIGGSAGLEYLLGWVTLEGRDGPAYHCRWATDRAQEKAAFEAFVDIVMARWAAHPDMHVYHYATYEPAAMKRLMGRHATREDEVDRMLRGRLFVDLHAIATQSLRASVERYSIKDLEVFYGLERKVDLRDASRSRHAFERALELGREREVSAQIRDALGDYNRDDCVSALHLRDWLEAIRSELAAAGEDIPRPVPKADAPPESVTARQERVDALVSQLTHDVPVDREERSPEQQARWLLANVLDWHRREEKAPWWEFFRLGELGADELLEERAGIAGLRFIERVGGTAACPIDRYAFPAQDTDLKEDVALHREGGEPLGKVISIDLGRRVIDIKKRGDTADVHPDAAFSHTVISAPEQAEALFRLGEWVAEHGVDAPGPHRAARDLLLGRPPRRRGSAGARVLVREGEGTTLAAARRLALELQDGVLPIQGPPGAGKTYTGARMICELVRAGKKVGITALSHKVIGKLLEDVVKAAEEEHLKLRCIQKVGGKPAKDEGQTLFETDKNQRVAEALAEGEAQVAAGTAWLWAREDMLQSVDVLFVDEAGQMSLANVLAVAQAAGSVVLIGDPQQLDQPLQGSHPEGTDVSALQHLLDGKQTIASDRGLFLAETRRLHPSICAMTSELFYEGRLQSRPELAHQKLVGPPPFTGAGLWFAPVEHEGNRNSSPEEVERVAALHEAFVSGAYSWVDAEGKKERVTAEHVLIVAPYNAHVSALAERIPGARVGTVDKFQGQEAPIVIYSMAASSPEEAPRGMEFLFSLNRLNVATSRARCACILVASPLMLQPECRTPRQIQLANAFCRYAELATPA